jgi:hypothetical protein
LKYGRHPLTDWKYISNYWITNRKNFHVWKFNSIKERKTKIQLKMPGGKANRTILHTYCTGNIIMPKESEIWNMMPHSFGQHSEYACSSFLQKAVTND